MRAALLECTGSAKPQGRHDEGSEHYFQNSRCVHLPCSSFEFRRALSKLKSNRKPFMVMNERAPVFKLRKFVVQLVGYTKLRNVSDAGSKDFQYLPDPSLSECI